jgi:Isochorismatase family
VRTQQLGDERGLAARLELLGGRRGIWDASFGLTDERGSVVVDARPEPLAIEPAATAVIVVKHKALGVGEPVAAPDGRDSRTLIEGTWGTEILSELTPEASDIVVAKHR